MLIEFKALIFSDQDFLHNARQLGLVAAYNAEKPRLLKAALSRKDSPKFALNAESGKVIGCQLLDVLLDGEKNRMVLDELLQQVQSFFHPLFGRHSSPLVNYVRQGEFKIYELKRA